MKSLFPALSFKLVIALLITSTLSACGFHLRSAYLVPEEISEISVTSFDPYSKLTRDVESQLRMNDVRITAPSENIVNLHLISENISTRTLSLYQNSSAAEKEILYTAKARMVIPEIGEKTFSTSVNRNYLDNPQTALAKSTEKELLQDEMRAQAASQIIRQMARLRAELQETKPAVSDDTARN
ncbi:luciferase [Vibrio albus]|uniref:LPS-assembly lipoprotein LptE n=1 Tax=Vibrio albus TaxID=2200953 RepID=A0A2U3BEG2_9VIBR|nr:LPS assembly lipoprotein LptE [Vibrio albus]PWI35176.1 luciferase [Vibrio albus]